MITNASSMLTPISEVFFQLIDSVGELTANLLGKIASPRTVRLVEDGSGEFILHADEKTKSDNFNFGRLRISEGRLDYKPAAAAIAESHVELVLQSDRFLFRLLELPNRATEFMPGIVRSQIDRLTPWNAADAAFGWSEPTEADAERMVVTIAATTLTSIKPYLQAMADIGAQSVSVFAVLPNADSAATPIKVWEQSGRGTKKIDHIRQRLMRVLVAACITAVIALAANAILGMTFSAQQDELARRMSGARSGQTAGSMTAAQRILERRKHEAPSTVLALEALSKILPDQTYVTELRLDGDKMRLTGVTRNAPSLISLIEQSGRFTRASFFAPTTRSTSINGDRFHIEAVVKPLGPAS
jgi:general secretion pathway protein L